MQPALSVSCIFQGRGGDLAASVLGGMLRTQAESEKFHQLPHVALGGRLAHLPVAEVLGDTNIFPIFNIINGNDPFRSKETGASIDKFRDSSLSG